jgi:putative phosphoribosyl transferase
MVRERVQIGSLRLQGEFEPAERPLGLVVFAQGSGSGSHCSRNRFIAAALHDYRLCTLLFDLLTEPEAADRARRVDIGLLADRLGLALDWALHRPELARRRIGLFGASTGSAAALQSAAEQPGRVGAVVSRGGRPELVAELLPSVRAPTLLVVGGNDAGGLDFNRQALCLLRCRKRLEVVPGANGLFDEPGALDSVAHLAGAWFTEHLTAGSWQ